MKPALSASPEVFILGSGFSRAVSDYMPMVRDLRDPLEQEVLGTLSVARRRTLPSADNFESFLGFLATAQPYLYQADNLENHALFLRASTWLARYLWNCQEYCFAGGMPGWLGELVAYWHTHECVVLTLNYDHLVEATALTLRLADDEGELTANNVLALNLADIGARFGAGLWGRASAPQTFRLVKLHGSLNWVYSGAPSFYGETIYTLNVVRPWDHDPTLWQEVEALSPGLVPLVVPPTPSKSSYFDNETVRALWQYAARALRGAKQLYVLGYSLPEADLQVRGLLETNCESLERVAVCDPSDAAAERVAALLASSDDRRIVHDRFRGESAIEEFVETLQSNPVATGG